MGRRLGVKRTGRGYEPILLNPNEVASNATSPDDDGKPKVGVPFLCGTGFARQTRSHGIEKFHPHPSGGFIDSVIHA